MYLRSGLRGPLLPMLMLALVRDIKMRLCDHTCREKPISLKKCFASSKRSEKRSVLHALRFWNISSNFFASIHFICIRQQWNKIVILFYFGSLLYLFVSLHILIRFASKQKKIHVVFLYLIFYFNQKGSKSYKSFSLLSIISLYISYQILYARTLFIGNGSTNGCSRL